MPGAVFISEVGLSKLKEKDLDSMAARLDSEGETTVEAPQSRLYR